MKLIALTASLCLLAASAQAAGVTTIQIPADADGPALKAMVWTPCAESAQEIKIGPYVLAGRRDCPTVGDKLPLVVMSHGHGGSFLGHHDLAEALADAGFVVAAVNHPGDTFSDMSRQAEMSEFIERPTDIKRLVDFMLERAPDAAKIDPARIGFFGFSRGGFTGLALAGGNPDFLNAHLPCPDPNLPICAQLLRKEAPAAPFTHDPRIKAFVIADPLNAFPTAESLEDVKAPIQLWASQFGGDGVSPETIPALAAALPTKPEFHLVSGAAHFAFLTPCSPQLAQAASEICRDGNGFDRAAFHREMNGKVAAFFAARLKGAD
jgi:predicted dienelactone hydrolase